MSNVGSDEGNEQEQTCLDSKLGACPRNCSNGSLSRRKRKSCVSSYNGCNASATSQQARAVRASTYVSPHRPDKQGMSVHNTDVVDSGRGNTPIGATLDRCFLRHVDEGVGLSARLARVPSVDYAIAHP